MTDINPGIRGTVAWLNANGFKTCDSGDGKTHDFECDRDTAYVVVQVPASLLVTESDRLYTILTRKLIRVGEIGPEPVDEMVMIQSTYDPANGLAFIDVIGLSDVMLMRRRMFPEDE